PSQSSTVESSSRDRDVAAAADSSSLDLNLAPSVRFPFRPQFPQMPAANQVLFFDAILRAGMVGGSPASQRYGFDFHTYNHPVAASEIQAVAGAQSDSDSSS
ncbi:hypothetical protein ACUX4R_28270, partial [Salmonella enterica]